MKDGELDLTFVRIANNKKLTSALYRMMKEAEEKGEKDARKQ